MRHASSAPFASVPRFRQSAAFAFVTATLVAGSIAGCGGSDNDPVLDPSATSPTNGGGNASGSGSASGNGGVSGAWSGTWLSSTGVGGGISSRLTQTGGDVTGEVSFTNSFCFSGGTFTATIDGDQLAGSLRAGSIEVRMTATVTSASVDGTYLTVNAGACTGDTGTFSFRR